MTYFLSLSNTNKLLVLSLIATMAITAITAMTTNQQTALAQQSSNSQACPPGFSLNRGVCQAEPELTCENYNVYQPRTNIDENGDCILTEYTTAVCLNEDGTAILGYYYDTPYCVDNATKQPIPNAEPACSSPTQPDHPINRATLTTERGTIECVYYTNIGPAGLKCDVGTLNEETEMCEIKPGRGDNRA
jgi:hypothetical protein